MARSKKWWDTFWSKNQDYGLPNETLLEYAKFSKKGLTAVDIASGNGRYAIALAKIGYKVDAIELSDVGVSRIKKDAKKEKVTVKAEQADFLKVLDKKKQYDVVFCSGLLEELDKKNHEKAIAGFMKWTKPGGLNIVKYCLENSAKALCTGWAQYLSSPTRLGERLP